MERRTECDSERETSSPGRISNVNLTCESHMRILSPGQVSVILDYDGWDWRKYGYRKCEDPSSSKTAMMKHYFKVACSYPLPGIVLSLA